jgi:peptide methionine sulfoxide reductase msrA/msrB
VKPLIILVPLAGLALLSVLTGGLKGADYVTGYRELTDEEAFVIEHGGTEAPFTGEYEDHWLDGTYNCRRCGAPLYDSDGKFDSGCGWPAFDTEIEGAVERRPDPDGRRTEILCANCGAHLGHVFEGEGFTETDTRQCVNSISLVFVPGTERAIFAGGCFWGVEAAFEGIGGVKSVTSGYTGGHTENPTYQDVCGGDTGHAEAVEIVYDPSVVGFEELARTFFDIHDPTTLNSQGPDYGYQYRSAVFYTTEEQREITERLIGLLSERGYDVVTQVEPAGAFWPAEDYHQDYFARNGGHDCHVRVDRFGD